MKEKHMKLLVLASFCLFTFSLTQPLPCKADSWYSYYEGYKYTVDLSSEQVQKAPEWLPSEDNPPLPARKALKAATDVLYQLLPDAAKWTLRSISLEPVCGHTGWAYVITFYSYFHAPPGYRGGFSGYLPPMTLCVLMDGKAIEPVVTKDTKDK